MKKRNKDQLLKACICPFKRQLMKKFKSYRRLLIRALIDVKNNDMLIPANRVLYNQQKHLMLLK